MKRLIELMLLAPAAAIAVPVLVDSSMKGALLLIAALLAALALRKASAALRHQLLVTTMIALLILPLLSWALPAWQVLPQWAQISKPAPAPSETGMTLSDSALGIVIAPVSTPAPTPPELAASSESTDWRPIVAWVWGIGGSLVAIWLTLGQLSLLRLARRSNPAPSAMATALEQCKTKLGVNRGVELLIHANRPIPMTWGVIKSRILLPAESERWTDERLRAVLLHELAHIKRRDCLTQLLVRLTCAVHWFNPLSWFAARKIATEQERACDDLVLGSGVRASEYAGHLLEIATRCDATSPAGSLAMAKPSRLEGRLTTILSRNTDRRGLTRRTALAIGIGLSVCAMPVAMMQAVAHEGDNAPESEKQPTKTIRASFSKIVVGEVISSLPDHGVVVIDAGTDQGLQVGQTIHFLRDGKSIASGTIVDLRDTLSGCAISSTPGVEQPRVEVGDRVYRDLPDKEDDTYVDSHLADIRRAGGFYLDLQGPNHPDELEVDLPFPEDWSRSPFIISSDGFPPVPHEGDPTLPFDSISLNSASSDGNSRTFVDPWGTNYTITPELASQWIGSLGEQGSNSAVTSELKAIQKMLELPKPSAGPSIAERAKTCIIRYPNDPAIKELAKSLTALESERATLLTTYVAKSPRVAAVEQRIETIEKQIVELGAIVERQHPFATPPIVGVGALLTKDAEDNVVVQDLIEGGPAERGSHLRPGDRITAVEVDGKFVSTKELNLAEVVDLIRGEAGTTVRLKLDIVDPAGRRSVIVDIHRAPIDLDALQQQQIARTYSLKFADAAESAEAIRQFIGRKATVVADVRTNSIFVQAAKTTHEVVEKMIEHLDSD